MRFLHRGRALQAVIGAIARIRADPGAPLLLDAVEGELTDQVVGEVAALRHDLRMAQLRAARLAAVVAVFGRFSHDMRGAISPALLLAERLQASKDPAVSRAGDMLVRTVERTGELLRETVAIVRAGGIPMSPSRFPLRELAAEAASEAADGAAMLRIIVTGPEELELEADRAAMRSVFVALLRNAAQAGARSFRVDASETPGETRLQIGDDASGLPPMVTQHLFEPLVPTPTKPEGGLGLAVVRHLIRANGGTIALLETGAAGTIFVVTLIQNGRSRGPT